MTALGMRRRQARQGRATGRCPVATSPWYRKPAVRAEAVGTGAGSRLRLVGGTAASVKGVRVGNAVEFREERCARRFRAVSPLRGFGNPNRGPGAGRASPPILHGCAPAQANRSRLSRRTSEKGAGRRH